MPSQTNSGHNDHCFKSSKESLLATFLEWAKINSTKLTKLAKAYGVPFVGVALAGPMVSMLPLGSLSPFVSLLATSFAGFYLRQNDIGGLCSFLHAGGLSGFEGQILSLLTFMSLSATFETLEDPLQFWFHKLSISIRGFQTSLTDLSLARTTEFTGLLGVLPHAIRANSTNAFLATVQAFMVLKGIALSRYSLQIIWRQLVGLFGNAISMVLGFHATCRNKETSAIGSTAHTALHRLRIMLWKMMSKESGERAGKDTTQQPLEDWEMIDFEETRSQNHLIPDSDRAAVLVGEITQLIDDCEGLEHIEWNELIVILEEEHKV